MRRTRHKQRAVKRPRANTRAFGADLILSDRLRQLIRNRLKELVGLGLLATGAALTVSLLSWSPQDPSFNHGTFKPPENMLGSHGAVIADMCFQTFGLASLLLILPLMWWGWCSILHHPPVYPQRRVLAGLAATAAAAGFFATVFTPDIWPLTVGLGGAIGDLFLRITFSLILTPPDSMSNILAGLVFLTGSFLLFIFSLGLRPQRPQWPVFIRRKPSYDDAEKEGSDGETSFPMYSNEEEEGEKLERRWPGAVISFLKRLISVPRHVLKPLRILKNIFPAKQKTKPSTGSVPGRSAYRLPDGRIEPFLLSKKSRERQLAEEEQEEHLPLPEQEGASINITPHTKTLKQDQEQKKEPGSLLLRKKKTYRLPFLTFLEPPKLPTGNRADMSQNTLRKNAKSLEKILQEFGVKGEIINVRPGPVVTLYELEPAPGIKSSRVIGLADDIARSMSAVAARVAVVSGRNAIGIELPNTIREVVYLRELLGSKEFSHSKARLPLALGKVIGGEPLIADLTRMPHLLIAGTTGSGKSVGINTMILSLIYRLTPEQCRLIMIDPKMLELSVYDNIPHLLTPVVTDPKKAIVALKWTVHEMEERYKKMSKLGVRNIDGFNQRVRKAIEKGEVMTRTVQTGFDQETGMAIYESEEMNLTPMPYLVVIVDEMADLMMVAGKEIEGAIQRLAQMARAAGIHMITATQRPSVDVITGTIKANFPTRVSFQVTSKIDSRTILGEQGAEQLLGQGDMLYMSGGGRLHRVHGPFVSDEDVEKVVNHLKSQGTPEYLEAIVNEDEQKESLFNGPETGEGESNELYDRAVQIVARDRKASTSYVQRRLSIGYNRAATLIERMEEEGIISAANHAGKREVLIDDTREE
ncbi:MAG: DNA translocase FtsK [Alphaproteobacteria bacterium]|nr:DNA translocase FtsK [Alphaproteobacteria bacterium]